MDRSELRQFEIICNTAQLFIASYYQRRFMPNWLFKRWHPRGKEVAQIDKSISSLKRMVKQNSSYDEMMKQLIKLLMLNYYHLCVRTVSKRLREQVLDALLACLNFSKEDVGVYEGIIEQKQNLTAYLNYFQNHQQLQAYRDYFSKKHTAYGMDLKLLGEQELTIAAKTGLVNGKLIERFGIRTMVARGLGLVIKELELIFQNRIEVGFLNFESIKGYIHKIEIVINSCEDPDFEEVTLIQNARYVLESIINTAGILPLGPARYPEHAVLIASCYWVDEFLIQARARVEIE